MASIKRNIFYNILLTTSQVAFSLVSLPYITRVLGPFELGRVSFVDSATQYFIITASLGIPIYGIREIAKVKDDPDALKKTFTELLLIQVLTTVLLLLIYFGIVSVVDRFRAEEKLFAFGFVQLIFSAFVTDWYFQGMENYGIISIRSFTMRLVAITAILVFVKDKADVYLYYGIWTVSVVINMVLSLSSSYKALSLKNIDLKRHLKPVFTFFSTKFFTSVYVILLSVFIGYLENKVYVAYFTSAYKIYTVCITFILAFSSVLIPKLSAYYKDNKLDESARLLSKNFNVVINYSLPIVAVMIFFAGPVVRIMLGEQFGPSATDLMLLAPLIVIISISNVLSLNVLTPMGMENKFLKASAIGMVFNLLIVFILIPALKDVGAAIALLLTECLVGALLYHYSARHLQGVSVNKRVMGGNILNCIISFGLLKLAADNFIGLTNLYWHFGVSIIGCGSIYLLIELFIVKDPYYTELFAGILNGIRNFFGIARTNTVVTSDKN